MTPLRQKMIDTLILKGYSPRTHDSYLYAIKKLAEYFHRSPDTLSVDELEGYLVYLLRERQLAPASVRLQVNAVRFFYQQVLQRPMQEVAVRYPKRPQRIPEFLTRAEVHAILDHTCNLKHYTLLATCYATSVRVSELVALQLRDIESARE